MKLETIVTQTTEVFIEGNNVSAIVNPWANCEGVTFMLHGKDLSIRLAASLRWEELDMLLVALQAARAA